jgi:hypothetical protein
MRANVHRRLGVALLAGAAAALIACVTPAGAAQATAPVPLTAAGASQAHADVRGVQRGAEVSRQTAGQLDSFRATHTALVGHSLGTLAVHPNVSIHPAQGTAFVDKGNDQGSFATQSVTTNLHPANGGTTIYTPTMYPAGGSCIEITTVYTNSTQAVEAWDWCNHINFEASVAINAAFVSKYTNGAGAYTAEILRTNASTNTWVAYLYDYTTGSYDTLYTSSGSTQAGTTGWDVNELYSDVNSSGQSYACADLAGKTFSGSNIQVDLGGTWTAAAPGNADTRYNTPASGFDCSSMSFHYVTQYSSWQVTG